MKKLSILIPLYNAEKYIAQLLKELLHQVDERCEIIVIDDGSTDDSFFICCDIQKNHSDSLKVFTRENKGTVLTRRELFDKSCGEWIWVIDADDFIVKDAIQEIFSCIYENNCDMLMFDYYTHRNGVQVVINQIPYPDNASFTEESKKNLYRFIANKRINALWSKVFKRECIDFDVDYSIYEDVRKSNDSLQLLPILTNAKTVLYKKTPLYYYNNSNHKNLTNTFSEELADSLDKVWKKRNKYILMWGIWEDVKSDLIAQDALDVCWLFEQFIRIKSKNIFSYYKFYSYIFNHEVFAESIDCCEVKRIEKRRIFLVWLFKKKLIFASYWYIRAGICLTSIKKGKNNR